MMALPDWQIFPTSQALAEGLAQTVAARLSDAIAARGAAFIAVSGGSTPKKFFAALSNEKIDWSKVTITLVDERFADEASDRSNASLVRSLLLVNQAATAKFIGLRGEADTVEGAAADATEALSSLAWPLDVVILGMGADGHTASFFPDAPNLADLTDPARQTLIDAVDTVAGGEPRLTLPLARLIEARFVALHIEGEEKRGVLEAAVQPGASLPISSVFVHARRPVPVYWAG